MVKGRINRLAYSGRSSIDYKNPGKTFLGGESIYKPGLLDVIASMRGFEDLNEAKERVSIDDKGNYKYTPSIEYSLAVARIKFRIKFKSEKDDSLKNERFTG